MSGERRNAGLMSWVRTSICVGVLAFGLVQSNPAGAADSPGVWKKIAVRKALRILLMQAHEELAAKGYVSYFEICEAKGRSSRCHWSFRGYPANGTCRVETYDAKGKLSTLQIVHEGLFYFVWHPLHGVEWRSRLERSRDQLCEEPGVTICGAEPLPAERDGWIWSLNHFPMVRAWNRGKELRVQFVVSQAARQILITRKLVDFLSGCLGYQVLLRRIDGRYCVVRAEMLQRAEVPAKTKGTRVLRWRPSKLVIAGLRNVELLGVKCGIRRRLELTGYRQFGRAVLPTHFTERTWTGWKSKGHIDPTSIVIGKEPQGAFDFKPPASWGPRGTAVNKITGTVKRVGDPKDGSGK